MNTSLLSLKVWKVEIGSWRFSVNKRLKISGIRSLGLGGANPIILVNSKLISGMLEFQSVLGVFQVFLRKERRKYIWSKDPRRNLFKVVWYKNWAWWSQRSTKENSIFFLKEGFFSNYSWPIRSCQISASSAWTVSSASAWAISSLSKNTFRIQEPPNIDFHVAWNNQLFTNGFRIEPPASTPHLSSSAQASASRPSSLLQLPSATAPAVFGANFPCFSMFKLHFWILFLHGIQPTFFSNDFLSTNLFKMVYFSLIIPLFGFITWI